MEGQPAKPFNVGGVSLCCGYRASEYSGGGKPQGNLHRMKQPLQYVSVFRSALAWYSPYLARLGLALVCLTGSRLVFALANRSLFVRFDVSPFWYGLHFDLATISYWYLPFHLLSLPPFEFLQRRGWQLATKVAFHFCTISALILNLIDAGYYAFSKQRSSFDTLVLLTRDMDVQHMWHKYALDWWYLVILFVAVVGLIEWLYRHTAPRTSHAPPWGPRLVVFGIVVAVLILGTRSEQINHPLRILNAGDHVPARLTPVVLNTPFVIIKSYGKPTMPRVYFTETELSKLFNPVRKFSAKPGKAKRNLVFIVIESLSSEFVGAYNGGVGYTPFFDTLASRGTVCTDSFASVRRTIDIGPALLAGLPMLTDYAFVRSPFAADQIDALPLLLKQIGYESWFFHGARMGSMSYDVFARKAGFDHIYTKNDYPGPLSDDDGHWGILDEPFLQFMAVKLGTAKQPFIAYVHTLTSHHPFRVPKNYEGRFPKGHHPICETIGYTDFALKRFFETAMTMPWYTNTIFVITGDHTAQFTHASAASPLAIFRVPILFFDPSDPTNHVVSKPVSHVDIFPTVLELVGWDGQTVSFGEDIFSHQPGCVVQYLNSTYQYVDAEWCLMFNGLRTIGLFQRADDPLCKSNLAWSPALSGVIRTREDRLKAYIQAYMTRMIRNELSLRR